MRFSRRAETPAACIANASEGERLRHGRTSSICPVCMGKWVHYLAPVAIASSLANIGPLNRKAGHHDAGQAHAPFHALLCIQDIPAAFCQVGIEPDGS